MNRPDAAAPFVDAAVHPSFASPDDIKAYLPRQYRDYQKLPQPGKGLQAFQIEPAVAGSLPADGTAPGSSAALMQGQVLERGGPRFVVMLPLGRGQLLDLQLACAVAAATNRWLAETWLGEFNAHGRYKGSIRVCPDGPRDAIKEIETWGDHPHFVQVLVPLESREAYGQPRYLEIWRAAAERGLPIAIHSDHSGQVLQPHTSLGLPLTYLEGYSQRPFYGLVHLASLAGHGLFDRIDSLRVVLADGAFDYVLPILWRMDKDWRSTRSEVPWMSRMPSDYLQDHVRFVVQASDGPRDCDDFARFVEINQLARILMYGSNYPHWDYLEPVSFAASLPIEMRRQILQDNARLLYRLPATARVGASAG